jgi:hypothetical protein
MPEPPSLTEFLLTRIAEDEELARDAATVRVREPDGSYQGLTPLAEVDTYVRYVFRDDVRGHHIAGSALWSHFNPARVLAECETSRQIIAACVPNLTAGGGYDEEAILAKLTLQLLALPYADHEAYDESWRP